MFHYEKEIGNLFWISFSIYKQLSIVELQIYVRHVHVRVNYLFEMLCLFCGVLLFKRLIVISNLINFSYLFIKCFFNKHYNWILMPLICLLFFLFRTFNEYSNFKPDFKTADSKFWMSFLSIESLNRLLLRSEYLYTFVIWFVGIKIYLKYLFEYCLSYTWALIC